MEIKLNSKGIGEVSEGMILARFLQLNWTVLLPFGDNQRYDLVIDRGNGFEKIQVKTGRIRNGVLTFHTCSSQRHRGKGSHSYRGQCDFFAVYCPDNKKTYIMPVFETTENRAVYRVEETKNNQKKKIKIAQDYEL